MGDVRSFTPGSFLLELDGKTVGFLKSVDGGATYADVIEEAVGKELVARKHLGPVRVEDFRLKVGLPLPKPLSDWVSAAWGGQAPRKDGAVVSLDFNLQVRGRREFRNALLTEVGFPACDASSKEAGFLAVGITPETASDLKAAGRGGAPRTKAQKAWVPANFRLEIDGLDCTRVSKIDAFAVKQKVAADPVGETRDYVKEAGRLEFPNLTVTLASVSAPTWTAWFEDFVLKGNNGQDKEKSGSITFLAPDLKDVLGRVRLFNLGIFRLAPAKAAPGAEQVARHVAALYCERMELEPSEVV